MSAVSLLFIGLLLGMKHATETDHLAAVATLVTQESSPRSALRLGALWGLGHTLTLFLFGAIALVLGKTIAPRLEQSLEFCVGLMLIALGADVLRRLIQQRVHFHVHHHGTGAAHIHAHSHQGEGRHEDSLHRHTHSRSRLLYWPHRRPVAARAAVTQSTPPRYRRIQPGGSPIRALAVGMMHGMAGSAALLLLSLQTVHSWQIGVLYIACFGVGSMAGMAILSVVISVPLKLSAGYLSALHRYMSAALGLFSCALGALTAYHIGVVEGLFRT